MHVVTCPGCGLRCRVATRSARVRCPGCNLAFTPPAVATPARPSPRRRPPSPLDVLPAPEEDSSSPPPDPSRSLYLLAAAVGIVVLLAAAGAALVISTRSPDVASFRPPGAATKPDPKADVERESSGLVLLSAGLVGTGNQFGGEISGTVVNRRGHRLTYASVTFNLYDRTGAKVGTAFAAVNGLDAGERWNFKAAAFGDFDTFKTADLSGF